MLDSELLCVHNHEKAKYVNLCNESDIGLMDRGEYKFIVAINEWIWVNVRVCTMRISQHNFLTLTL